MIFSQLPECKPGERWALSLIVNNWIHHVGVREGQKDQAKNSTNSELLLCDQSVILESS